jgi:predicted ATPase
MTETEILEHLGDIPDNQANLRALVRQMQTGNGIVPFIGAGMSARFGFPEWSVFLRNLAKRANLSDAIEQRISAGQYEEAAGDLIAALGSAQFQQLMADNFGNHVLQGKQLDGAVALVPRLSSGPVITTNFDGLLEKVFQNAGCPFELVVWHSKANLAIPALAENLTVLLKIHGDWRDPDDRVLTYAEYKENYGDPDGQLNLKLPLPMLFERMAIRPVLFLGCSLQQDRTVAILKSVVEGDSSLIRHFGVVQRLADDAAHEKRAADLLSRGIVPIWYPAGRHEKIQALLQYLAGQVPAHLRRTGTERNDVIPRPLTSFIGRDREGRDLRDLLKTRQLLTISGPPGCGKTRVAIELARSVRSDFDSVWFVELSQLQDEKIVPQRVAAVLGIREMELRPPTEVLADFLKQKKYLIVLDNCEHLIAACASLANYLVRECPDLKIVTTSRRVLGVPGEKVYLIPTLVLPDARKIPDIQELARVDSVALLLERAQARSDFKLTAENAKAVASLCRKLEGIPLAVELAAAQLDTLSVDDILAHMNRRLELLTGGTGGTEERLWATLREALNLSHSLLNAEQKLLFHRVSIFSRGWTWEAATAICREGPQNDLAINRLLNELYGMSLIVVDDIRGSKRFRLLDFVREYAAEKLASEEAAIAERHSNWYLDFAEKLVPELLKKDQAQRLNELAAEADNFRAAIAWAVDSGRVEFALRITGALWRLMEIRGFYREGRERLSRALDMPNAAAYPQWRGRALSGLGMMAYRQGDMDTAGQSFSQALEIERARDNSAGIANALNDLGNVAHMRGNFETARTRFRECLEIERRNGNARAIAVALYNLGKTARSLKLEDEAFGLLDEARQMFESAGNVREAAFALNTLALLALTRDDVVTALRDAKRSLEMRKEVGDQKGIADTSRTLAAIRLKQGELGTAYELVVEAAELARGVNDKIGIVECFELLGALAAVQQAFAWSVALYSAADKVRTEASLPLAPVDSSTRDSYLALARAGLGETAFTKAWEAHAPLDISNVVSSARSRAGSAGH